MKNNKPLPDNIRKLMGKIPTGLTIISFLIYLLILFLLTLFMPMLF